MLADRTESAIQSGGLDREIHLPGAWRLTLLAFIADQLPKWRDDPARPDTQAETSLTSQLCAYLNGATRAGGGWDYLQFRIEEPDETRKGRKVDLVPAPSAATLWIDGREYSQYVALLPIECKRLPTPSAAERDEREYLFSAHSTTGGVQRFKAGHHGAVHSVGAMIAYIQALDVDFWVEKIQHWTGALVTGGVDGWEAGDGLRVVSHDGAARTAQLESVHRRQGDLPEIRLHHLWIEMSRAQGAS